MYITPNMPLNFYTRPNKSVLVPELATASESEGLCMVCHDAKVQGVMKEVAR